MGITKVAFFVYFVKDIDRAKAFYTDVLNLPVSYETPAWVQFKTEGGTLALHLADAESTDVTNEKAGGIIGFQVDNLEQYAEYLKQHNVKLKNDIRNEHFGKLLDIYDPDGNSINLFEPAHVAHAH